MRPKPTCAPLLVTSTNLRLGKGTELYATRTYSRNGTSDFRELGLCRLKKGPNQQYQNASNLSRLVGKIALAAEGKSPNLSSTLDDPELQILGL